MSFLTAAQLEALQLAHLGRDVCIDATVQLYGCERISIGDNVRIDAFSILSASQFPIEFAGHSHIGAGTYLFANGGAIRFDIFSNTSPGCRLFTATDDFADGLVRGPNIPREFRSLKCGPIHFRENAGIGANCVVLPGCTLGVNATSGAGTVISTNLPDHTLSLIRGPLRSIPKDPAVYESIAARTRESLRAQGYHIE